MNIPVLSEHDDDKEILKGDRQEANLASTMPIGPAPITRAISCPPRFEQPYAQPIVTTPVQMPFSTPTESCMFCAALTQTPACYTISSGDSFHPTASTRKSTAPGTRPLFQFHLRTHTRCLHSSVKILFPHPRFLILIPFLWLPHTFPFCQCRILLHTVQRYEAFLVGWTRH